MVALPDKGWRAKVPPSARLVEQRDRQQRNKAARQQRRKARR